MADRVRAAFADPAPEPDWTDRYAVVEYLVEGERRFAGHSFDHASVQQVACRVVGRTVNLESSTKDHWLVDGGEDTRPRLGEVSAPTLVIHGAEDPLFPPGRCRSRDSADERATAGVGAQARRVDGLRLRGLLSPTSAPLGRRCDSGRMTAWQDVERAEPEFAQRVRGLFDAHRHKTIATLRADGSPRISGIEAAFEDGELTFGSMPNARKGADLRRDPRFALHSATVDPVEGSEAQWPGEAKISGRAIYAGSTTAGPDGDLFYGDIAEVVHTHLNEEATMLVVEWWTPTHGLRRIERE